MYLSSRTNRSQKIVISDKKGESASCNTSFPRLFECFDIYFLVENRNEKLISFQVGTSMYFEEVNGTSNGMIINSLPFTLILANSPLENST